MEVKIHMKTGRIITLTVIKRTDKYILGDDKYEKPVLVQLKDIHSMLPVETKGWQ